MTEYKPPLSDIRMTEDEYRLLVSKIMKKNATKRERSRGHDGLFLKYCRCIRKVAKSIKKYNVKRSSTKKKSSKVAKSKKNEYAVCRHSVYKNRGIKPSMRFMGRKLKHKSFAKNCKEETGR